MKTGANNTFAIEGSSCSASTCVMKRPPIANLQTVIRFLSIYTFSPNPPKTDSITVPSRVQNRKASEKRERNTRFFVFPHFSHSHSF